MSTIQETLKRLPASRPRRRGPSDRTFRRLCELAAGLILVVAGLLVGVLVWKSWLAITTYGLSFLGQTGWNPVEHAQQFGALAFVYGTLSTSAIAMLIAVPLGVGTAVYLSEIATGRTRQIASFFIEMLAAIPSVVYGFWGVYVLAPLLQVPYSWIGADSSGGMGILAAGLILSIMIVPYIAAIGYDVCQAVPRAQREGALALGATRWQTIWQVVLPYAKPGILGGCFLALGRALGETMAVTMLIGNVPRIPWLPFYPGDSIASVIANQYVEASYPKYKSVLVELGLLLLLVTVLINVLARWLIWRVGRTPPHSLRRRVWESGSSDSLMERLPDSQAPGPAPVSSGWLSARQINQLMTGLLGSCVIITMGLLVVILSYLLFKGMGALSWDFFTQLPVPPKQNGGGLANALVGSLQVVGLATLFAVPVGLLAAIYLAEYRPTRLSISVRFVAELLSGVPSIIIGIFAAVLFSLIADTINGPLGTGITLYGWSGIFALAVMMLPVVLRASEEALKLVPNTLRNASYALGGSQAQTVLRVTVPAALPAIITGIFLAVARIAGETAPLLLTAGFNNFWPDSLGDFLPTLPPYIFKYATSPYENQQRMAWAAAFVLMVVVLVLNFGIRFATGKRVVQASRAE